MALHLMIVAPERFLDPRSQKRRCVQCRTAALRQFSRSYQRKNEPLGGRTPHRIFNGPAPPVKRYVLKYSRALASGSE